MVQSSSTGILGGWGGGIPFQKRRYFSFSLLPLSYILQWAFAIIRLFQLVHEDNKQRIHQE